MGKPTGFLDYARMDCPARSAEARVADWAPLDLPLSEKPPPAVRLLHGLRRAFLSGRRDV